MKTIRKHRKLLYVPGMISLLLLPVLGYTYFKYNKSFVVYRSMDFSLLPKNPVDWPQKKPNFYYSNEFLTPQNVGSLREYKTFVISGSEAEEADKLVAIRSEFLRMVKDVDTLHGVKIHFGKTAHYDTFIRTLDYIAIVNMPAYGLFGNDLYAVVPPLPKPTPKVINMRIKGFGHCGNADGDDNYYAALEREQQQAVFIRQIKKDWEILAALLALMLLNIFSLVRFNANKILYLKNHSKWHF